MSYYMTQREVAEFYRISERTLEGWRSRQDNGPGWVKIGNRVRYPRDAVERFARENFHEIVKYQKAPADPLRFDARDFDGDDDFGRFLPA